jgi:hypothetical protein
MFAKAGIIRPVSLFVNTHILTGLSRFIASSHLPDVARRCLCAPPIWLRSWRLAPTTWRPAGAVPEAVHLIGSRTVRLSIPRRLVRECDSVGQRSVAAVRCFSGDLCGSRDDHRDDGSWRIRPADHSDPREQPSGGGENTSRHVASPTMTTTGLTVTMHTAMSAAVTDDLRAELGGHNDDAHEPASHRRVVALSGDGQPRGGRQCMCNATRVQGGGAPIHTVSSWGFRAGLAALTCSSWVCAKEVFDRGGQQFGLVFGDEGATTGDELESALRQ